VFRTRRLRDHIGRSWTQAVAQSLLIIAFSLMPLGGAIAINFSAPLFATLFAALWLKEKVGLARACALIAGFLGVLLVATPGADSFRLGALFALGNAVLFGSVTAAVRGMTVTESAETLTMYQMVLLLAFFAVAMPLFGMSWPSGLGLAAMLANGLLNGFGQYWWTRALSLAPPAAVGPFYYFSLVWAISAAVAAAAGLLLAPVTLIDTNMGLAVALKAFAAAVVGGFGSIPGALVGGITIGLIELYAGATLPEGIKNTAPYIVLLIMLTVRPQGLFGTPVRKRV